MIIILRQPRAFTLIELLVVITIIVILLALLTPALDRALYQAELTICAAQQRSVAQAATSYAAGHKRHYPQRMAPGAVWGNNWINQPAVIGTEGAFDMRTTDLFTQFVSLDAMHDPLTGADDIDFSIEANDADVNVLANYHLWFGWQYVNHAGMNRMGERFGWNERRYRVMVSDFEARSRLDGWYNHSHPDVDGVMSLLKLQGGFLAFSPFRVTAAFYNSFNHNVRGLVDSNVAYDDLSVERFDRLEENDPRMTEVPETSDGGGWTGEDDPGNRANQIPADN